MSRIVVGVDGSDESKRALRWAADEARLRNAILDVVYAYDDTPAWQLYGFEAIPVGYLEPEVLESGADAAGEHARKLVNELVDELGPVEDLEIERTAVADRRPAAALVERSRNSDMLVIGSRGRGGFAGLLLGSVSQQCATHAWCPVVIVGRPHT